MCVCVCLSIYAVYLAICLSIFASIYLPRYLSASLKTKLFCGVTSSNFELGNIKNAVILRDFLNFWIWQRQKRNKSARLPQISFWQHQKRSNSGRLPSKMESWAELTASYQCVVRFFQSMSLKYCACHEKVMPGHTKCCTCHTKSSYQTWRSDAPKCNPSQEISARTS